MKRAAALLAALCLVMCAPALAVHEITSGTPEVDVWVGTYVEENARYNNGFTVYIPENVEFANGAMSQTASVQLEVNDTEYWRDGTRLSVELQFAEHFQYGYDEEADIWWRHNTLEYAGGDIDYSDYDRYSIPYSIYRENGLKLYPWNFGQYEYGGDDVYFDDEGDGQVLKYIWCMGDCYDREQTAELRFVLEPGGRVLKGGRYEDRLTFTVDFRGCHCAEIYYEGDGIKIPAPLTDEEHGGWIFTDGTYDYYRTGDMGPYYYMEIGEEADVSGIHDMRVRFPDWSDALIPGGETFTIGEEGDPLCGLTLYNDFIGDDYAVFPLSRYAAEFGIGNDLTGDWLNTLSFDPNTESRPW